MVFKLLILSASVGAGHTRAAQAVEETARRQGPDVHVLHRNTLDFVGKAFGTFYEKSYLTLVNHLPELWGYYYAHSDQKQGKSQFVKLSQFFDKVEHKKLVAFVQEECPDAVLCTHFLPMNLLLTCKDFTSRAAPVPSRGGRGEGQQKTIPVWTLVTDFDAHYFWVNPQATGYFVGNEEVRWQLYRRGISWEQVQVTGIPVHPVFAESQRKERNKNNEGKTVLVLSGGLGIGEIEKIVATLLQGGASFRIVAMAGKNEKLKKKLEELQPHFPNRLTVHGYVTNMEDFLARSDVVVTKAGGLTTNECLIMGTPMILFAPIPGQEECNSDYLLEHGAALKAKDLPMLEYKVTRLLKDPGLYDRLRESALRLATPNAARKILDVITNSVYTKDH